MKKIFSIAILLCFWLVSFSQGLINLPANFSLPEGQVPFSGEVTEVKSQGRTGTCWSFSTTSFLESELLRLGRGSWDLSEMFTVRMIYLDKADQYVRFQGTTNFSQGSLGHDVLRVYKKYGMMPESAYSGKNGKEVHNHSKMEKEMKSYLDTMIKSGTVKVGWENDINAIMDRHMGEIPEAFEVNGEFYNPRTFADEVLKLDVDQYVGLTSFIYQPLHEEVVVEVPDNYSRGEYFNVELPLFTNVIYDALDKGFTIEWDGDVSGGGFNAKVGFAIYIPDSVHYKSMEDMPQESSYNQDERQAEFDSYATTDDHLMHVVGTTRSEDGKLYYIVKNSWGNKVSFDGFVLMSEAYMAMKTVCIIMHRDALPEDLRELIPPQSY